MIPIILRWIIPNSWSPQSRLISSVRKRTNVRLVDPAAVQWFPGHMRRGMNEIDKRIALVDAIIEVHDARIPFSGRSSFVQRFDQIRPHILVLNKVDLAEEITNLSAFRSSIIEKAKLEGHNLLAVYLTQLNSPERQRRLLQRILGELCGSVYQSDPVQSSNREFPTRTTPAGPSTLMCMVVGIPNSGKSTLINALRAIGQGGAGRAARVGRSAGQTRSVGQPIMITRSAVNSNVVGGHALNEDVRIMMLDTPGILEPQARTLSEQLSLAVCGALNWSSVNLELLLDYLLFWWNHRGRSEYVSVLDLPEPTDNVLELLVRVCAHNSFYHQSSVRGLAWQASEAESVTDLQSKPLPDLHRACSYVLKLFERGAFGRATFLPSDEEAASRYFVLAKK